MISISGKKWIFPKFDERKVLTIKQKFEVSDALARILSLRDLSLDDITTFLYPKIKDLLPNPSLLLDMDAGIQRMVSAIMNHEKIVIYGDYDVDGATSVALLYRYFEEFGVKLQYYIPDRLSEGYGVNKCAIQKICQTGASLIVMVDCGTTSIAEVKMAKSLGTDSIILDHHSASVELPDSIAVINPHRIDQHFVPHIAQLCAAGVVFLFLVGLQRELKKINFFSQNVPNLLKYCDLVALGTICDIMPLRGLNRAFVKVGLEIIRQSAGLKELINIAGIKEKISATHVSFAIGPRINAGGRVGSSLYGVQLLTTHDSIEAKEIAIKLNQLNEERQHLEQKILEEAITQIESAELYQHSTILICNNSWHVGLIGIVASRLKERYHRPCFVASFDSTGVAKGSARSVTGVDVGQLIHQAVQEGILICGGGHSMAGGFSIMQEKLTDFYTFLNSHTFEFMEHYQPTIEIDVELSFPSVSLARELQKLEPFGVGNPMPRFCFNRMQPIAVNNIGTNHLQCIFVNETRQKLNAIAFRSHGTKLGNAMTAKKVMSVVGTLKEHPYSGNVQLFIEDVVLV
ncbi:MAG: single-stranded-DNA-specific exonuclease RecJ [Holosporales bacterium]|jgi:single-stranded-DNA-specific exonuclease|nr:single-stranded-DNA-specific exonuclease RecJ [Holosporales bacterium]